MKQLLIEEKAKAYDEAKLRISKAYNENRCTIGFMNEIFPELKESEDERMRNAAINACKYMVDNFENSTKQYEEAIAWLEKQGDIDRRIQEEIEKQTKQQWKAEKQVEPKFKVGDVMRTLQEASDDFTDGMPVVVSIDDKYYHCTNELIAIKDQDSYEYPPINREQKPAWSEEDKCMLNNVIDTLKPLSQTTHSGYAINSMIAWLKSIKDKVQPQPKQEWSEEDEYNIAFIVELLYGIEDSDKEYENKCRKMANWLKSLRPQNTWKPSERQMEVLDDFLFHIPKEIPEKVILVSLLNDLKKLREK